MQELNKQYNKFHTNRSVYWTWPSLYLTMVRCHQQAQCWLPNYAWYCLFSGFSKYQLLPTILYIPLISNMFIDSILVLDGQRTSLRLYPCSMYNTFQCYYIHICFTPIECCNRTLPNYQALMSHPIFFSNCGAALSMVALHLKYMRRPFMQTSCSLDVRDMTLMNRLSACNHQAKCVFRMPFYKWRFSN